ncbi:MAG: hypothetical protein IPL99_24735 [Candidatus Competibacteraceae bacterium]|nr:hypothetical protein [Candidatus Competibacteraceae bacterium]
MKQTSTNKRTYASKKEAVVDIDQVNYSEVNRRKLLCKLHAFEAWKLFGYRSFRAMAKERLKMGDSSAYREVEAGRVEKYLGIDMGSTPESVLRPLYKLPAMKGCKVYDKAVEDNNVEVPTAKMLRIAAEKLGYLVAKAKKKNADDPEGILSKLDKITDLGYLKVISQTAHNQFLVTKRAKAQ